VNCCWIGAGALWQAPDTATATTMEPLVVRIPVSPHSMDPGTKAVMNRLDAVETFALGGVGYAGAPNKGQTIALLLAQLPDATEAFTWLADHGSPAARLYGYWALRTLAPEQAKARATSLVNDAELVDTMSGCLAYRESVGSIVARMQDPDDGVGADMPRP
jgi:hypothetical protein